MIRALCLSLALLASLPVSAVALAPVRLDFQAVNVSQVVGLVYVDAMPVPFVIAPELLDDKRVVSFRFNSSDGDLLAFWRVFLDSLGYSVVVRSGVHFIGPQVKPLDAVDPKDLFVYRPRHRSVRYLVDLLAPVFPSTAFSVQRGISSGLPGDRPESGAPAGSAAALVNVDSDVLVFNGTAREVERFKAILPSLDVAIGEVVVKAIVYEVTTGRSEASAFSLAASILGGRLGVSLGDSGRLEDALTIRTGSIDAAISAFKGDSRFKAVSTPSLRVKSGQRAPLMVGQDVPTLSSVSFAQGSSVPVQAIEYRSSGTILNVLPVIREGTIDVQVDLQMSDFAKTQTGVNNSPTLTRRSLSTTVGMADGELVVLGGLSHDKSSASGGGQSFLPSFMRGSDSSDSRTEVLLMLEVTRVVSSHGI